ncbi:MAG: AAA family ATPase [Pirellulaceae bacterium]|jgi:predicted ATPase with chaperone activity|nr:AAA family ATPase [Pirellulaceae bacterium]
MTVLENTATGGSLLAAILSDETFVPAEPGSIEETGLSSSLVEALICKYVLVVGSASGRQIAEQVCLPLGTLEGVFRALRQRQILVHSAAAQMNDYYYMLTEQGRQWAQRLMESCAYVGAAPVPLVDYVVSVEAQTIRAEAPKQHHLAKAFADISIESDLLDQLGPAINSGAGLFLYGAPGNGKTTLAARITMCFGQDIWIPKTLTEDGQLIKLYDAAYHRAEVTNEKSLLKNTDHDRRWIKIRRPTVIVGGELTLDSLEIRHDPVSNVSEAPLQLKSNCGCLLIDDFGRQRIEPTQLLNRWIIPLENRQDFLTIATGKKIQVPFEQLIIFSTNLDPTDLADEAFLRRIPYKIEVQDPSMEEFHRLFESLCRSFHCEYRRDVVDALVRHHYQPYRRPVRRCHPRDLLLQIRNYCAYHDLPLEMTNEHFDRVVRSYFTALSGMGDAPVAAALPAAAEAADNYGVTERLAGE